MGIVSPNLPASDANETAYVSALVGIHNGPVNTPTVVNGNTIVPFNWSAVDGILPTPVTFGDKLESNLSGVLGAGYQYALAKYGGGQNGFAYVYYLGGAGLDIPDFGGTRQWELSHVTLFNASGTSVPDGGATALLLGMGVIGLAAVKRKK